MKDNRLKYLEVVCVNMFELQANPGVCSHPGGIYLFNANNGDTRAICEICS